VVSGFGFLPSASADNATATSPMAPTYTIQAHVYKDWGIPRTTRWVTSAWTYHGAARQSMTRIRDTTTLASSVGTFTWSCSVGLSGESPTGNCTGTPGSGTYSTTLYWENGNTYESDINGYMYLSWNTTWDQVCASASAYSSPLGIHGNTSACVG
jgi:hypothetical protein